MSFLTERETEAWLTLETRSLPMPDGTLKPINALKLVWANFDMLLDWKCYTVEELIDLAIRNSKATGCTFEHSFQDIVAYCNNDARKKLGFD